jgi:hypothetical protein
VLHVVVFGSCLSPVDAQSDVGAEEDFISKIELFNK